MEADEYNSLIIKLNYNQSGKEIYPLNSFITARANQYNGTSFILQMTSLAIEPETRTD